jgi:hypothetical protein
MGVQGTLVYVVVGKVTVVDVTQGVVLVSSTGGFQAQVVEENQVLGDIQGSVGGTVVGQMLVVVCGVLVVGSTGCYSRNLDTLSNR